jgi:cytochrome c oxidase subunit III
MSVALAAPRTTIPHTIIEQRRGSHAMLLFILTEAVLFLMLFVAYYYLGHAAPVWPPEPPPFTLALVMLALLATSSAVLHWGERQVDSGHQGSARAATAATILLGLAFLGVQTLEYHRHLQLLQPTSDAYGSIFYAITGLHAAHVVLGLLMLAYVLLLPDIKGDRQPPHRPLHNASLYWHFVDFVWVVIVGLIYLAPNVTR